MSYLDTKPSSSKTFLAPVEITGNLSGNLSVVHPLVGEVMGSNLVPNYVIICCYSILYCYARSAKLIVRLEGMP